VPHAIFVIDRVVDRDAAWVEAVRAAVRALPGARAARAYVAAGPNAAVAATGLAIDSSHAGLLHLEASDLAAAAARLAAAVPSIGSGYRVDYRCLKAATAPAAQALYALVVRHPDLDATAFDRHWRDVHAPLALRHHIGMSEYEQHVVRETLVPGARAIDGIALLGFPSPAALATGMFDSTEGRRIVGADTARFLDVGRMAVTQATPHYLLP
jgi:uncharacterized protein (TIGR02118 family)